MRILKQALGVLGALVVVAVIMAFVAPKRTHALVAALVQIVPGSTTHVGQNESQLISLFCRAGDFYCLTIDSSGVFSTTPYAVPAGYTLIVTDWEWFYSVTGEAGGLVEDVLYNINATPGQLAISQAVTASNGATAHEHYETGIRVGSGAEILDYLTSIGGATARIQGYLVPND